MSGTYCMHEINVYGVGCVCG